MNSICIIKGENKDKWVECMENYRYNSQGSHSILETLKHVLNLQNAFQGLGKVLNLVKFVKKTPKNYKVWNIKTDLKT